MPRGAAGRVVPLLFVRLVKKPQRANSEPTQIAQLMTASGSHGETFSVSGCEINAPLLSNGRDVQTGLHILRQSNTASIDDE